MAKRGGKREGAGRPPKADEQALIEKLSPLDELAFNALEQNIMKNEGWAIKLFFEYRFGKPKQSIDHTTDGKKINIPIAKWV